MWPLSLLHFLPSHSGIITAFLLLSTCVCVCVSSTITAFTHRLRPVADGSFQFTSVPTLLLSSFAVTRSLCHLFAPLHEPCADLPPHIRLHQHRPPSEVCVCVSFDIKQLIGSRLLVITQVWILILGVFGAPRWSTPVDSSRSGP